MNAATRRAAGEIVQHADFLGDADRVVDGEQLAEQGDPCGPAALGDSGGHHRGVGRGAVAGVVMFGQADPVKAEVFSEFAFFHAFLVGTQGNLGGRERPAALANRRGSDPARRSPCNRNTKLSRRSYSRRGSVWCPNAAMVGGRTGVVNAGRSCVPGLAGEEQFAWMDRMNGMVGVG